MYILNNGQITVNADGAGPRRSGPAPRDGEPGRGAAREVSGAAQAAGTAFCCVGRLLAQPQVRKTISARATATIHVTMGEFPKP